MAESTFSERPRVEIEQIEKPFNNPGASALLGGAASMGRCFAIANPRARPAFDVGAVRVQFNGSMDCTGPLRLHLRSPFQAGEPANEDLKQHCATISRNSVAVKRKRESAPDSLQVWGPPGHFPPMAGALLMQLSTLT